MRWFPVAFLTNNVLKVTHGGIELTTPVLRVCMLSHYATVPRNLNNSKAKFVAESCKCQFMVEEKQVRIKSLTTDYSIMLEPLMRKKIRNHFAQKISFRKARSPSFCF